MQAGLEAEAQLQLGKTTQNTVFPGTLNQYLLQHPDVAGSFDVVVCTLVLCSVPDVADAVEQIAKLLKPQGKQSKFRLQCIVWQSWFHGLGC